MRAILLALGLLAACGPTHGTKVTTEAGGPEWTRDPNLFERTERAASVAAVVWGGSATAAEGWEIDYVSGYVQCGLSRSSIGCTDYDDKVVTLSFTGPLWAPAVCVEATELAHEMGHVVLPVGSGHVDPRWKSLAFWGTMGNALKELVPDDVVCQVGIDTVMFNEQWMVGP